MKDPKKLLWTPGVMSDKCGSTMLVRNRMVSISTEFLARPPVGMASDDGHLGTASSQMQLPELLTGATTSSY